MGRIHILLVSAALAASVLLGSGGAGAATKHSYITVNEFEYRIGTSRTSVPHGVVTVTVVNYGADDHNLFVGKGPHRYYASARIPGGTGGSAASRLTFNVTLKIKGRYNFYCGIPGHRALGMVAHVTVT